MRLSEQIKPASYVREHLDELLKQLEAGHPPLIITQDGEAKAILQDLREYERAMESVQLLQVLIERERELERDGGIPLDQIKDYVLKHRVNA